MQHVAIDGIETHERSKSYAYWNVVPPRSLVVLVHGWGGDKLETWAPTNIFLQHSNTSLGPHDFLFYSYDSRDQPAAHSATNFLHFMTAFVEDPNKVINASAGIGIRNGKTDYTSITFVCHSLGAVIVRRALLDLATRATTRPDWLDRAQLLLFAPAHKGASAPAALKAILSTISSRFGNLVGTAIDTKWKSLVDLTPGSSFLSTLEEESNRHLASFDGAPYARARMVAWAEKEDVVVTQNFGRDPPAHVLRDTDHVSICKPREPSDASYTLLINHL